MRKKKYYFILLILVLFVAGFKLQSFRNKPVEQEKPVAVAPPPYNPVVEIESTLNEFDSLLDLNFKESGSVGAAAVVTYKGKIALLRCYGVCKAGEDKAVNENTVFRLASVSKSVTGVLAGILDDENIVHLDSRVVDYLPGFSLKSQESTQSLKLRHLLSHTSGLVPHAYDLMVEDMVPLNRIMDRLKEVDISAPPGELYGYQNVIYSIYGPVVQTITHKTFSELLKEKVFIPFEMKDASVGYEAFKNNDNKAYPHCNKGHNQYAPMHLNNRYYSTAPAAGVNASISDLGHLLANLTDPASPTISENAREIIFTPQVKSHLSRTYFRSWGHGVQSKQYSIGWRIVNYKGREIAYHGGYVLGYKAEIAYCEEEDLGIAYLCNSPNSLTAHNIPDFFNLIFAEKDKIVMENHEKQDQADDNKS